jgi:hypothetical protein
VRTILFGTSTRFCYKNNVEIQALTGSLSILVGVDSWTFINLEIQEPEPGNETQSSRWTFTYRKFGQKSQYVYFLIGANHEILKQAPPDLIDTVDFEIVFTEVTDDESGPYEAPTETVFEPSLGMVFDFLFASDIDPVSVMGLLSAVILLGIVWAYRVFCFELY